MDAIGEALVGVAVVVGLLGVVIQVELGRRRDRPAAWRATVAALKATGLGILVELAGSLVATGTWVVGLLLT